MQTETVFAGFGGQGILFAGQILARAGLAAGYEVTWLPSYGPEMRGGTANVTVIVSDEEIGAPIVRQPMVGVIFNLPSMEKYEPLVKTGGTLVYNSSLINTQSQRSDIKIISVPANDLAKDIGDERTANMVMLGAMIAATRVLPLPTVIETLRVYLASRAGSDFEADAAALRCGAQLLEPADCSLRV
jgi:2-oxoglutarate ferredoxin oxidoreductase subunit gamma